MYIDTLPIKPDLSTRIVNISSAVY